ncbi:kinase-like domain-containing protein [Mycena latifolia]|nr:kinase-like domain-containing protein [Mycena latifolia]
MDATAVHIKEASKTDPAALSTERIIYSSLPRHPRILECLNTSIYSLEDVESRIRVSETEDLRFVLAPSGDLQKYLFNHPDVPQRLRAKWGVQIAEGLAFLHSHNIVWADCSPANMLLTADLDILLCDFGGSGIAGGETNVIPPVSYLDPSRDFASHFKGERRLDIYAFGCVFLQILAYNADFLSPEPPAVHRGGLALDGQPLIDNVRFMPFKLIVQNCWDDKYADAQQLFADVSDAWVQFQQDDRRSSL